MPRNWRFWEKPEGEEMLPALPDISVSRDGLRVSVPPGPKRVVAEVVKDGPKMVTMYRDATPVEVPVSEIPKFQSLGFLLHKPEDLNALAREVGSYANEMYPLMMKLADAVMEDGYIDPDEEGHWHALTKAHDLVGKRLQDFANVLFQNYPVREG